jgi:hypothetical protein
MRILFVDDSLTAAQPQSDFPRRQCHQDEHVRNGHEAVS